MQFIKRIHIVPVDDERYFMLNGMTGAIDLIDESVYQLYKKWANSDSPTPNTPFEQEMFHNFQQGEYLMEPEKEEERVSQLLQTLEEQFMGTKPRVSPIFLLTYDCNFRCSYCYEQSILEHGEDKLKEHLTPEVIKQLFQYFDEKNMSLGDVTLYGGEPLLLQNKATVKEILEQANARGAAIKIISNGFTLDEYAPLLATANIKLIQITLDGGKEHHNQTRYTVNKKGTFEKIVKGIIKAREYDLPLRLRCNVGLTDDDQIQSLLDALKEHQLDNDPGVRVYFAPIAEMEGSSCGNDLMSNFLTKVESHLTHPMVVKDFLTRVHTIANIFLKPENWAPKYAFCSAQYGQQIFDPWGNIYPCQVLVGNEKEAIGSFDDTGIQYNDKYTAWDTRTIDKIDKCRECEIAFFCGGGCPLTPLYQHGRVDHHGCDQIHDTLETLLPYLYKKYYADAQAAANS